MSMFRFIDRARERRSSEQGFYMVWFALTFVTLTAFAGLALEYNRWQQIGTRAQKAADAAALGGAVFMPENAGNKAFTTAKTIASENGFTNGSNGVTITTAGGRLPNQLKVTVSVVTKNPWGALVNYGRTTIVKSAVAEYQLPQNLGSPQNSYGNDPESAAASPQFWGNVFGPSSVKSKGDAIQSVGPAANSTLCPTSVDNCNGPATAPVTNQNGDYDANGYFYGIDVPAGTSGALDVQVFDPAFVHVGDTCGAKDSNGNYTDSNAYTALTNAATLSAGSIPGYPAGDPPSVRYAPGINKYCTGDNFYGDNGATAAPWTVWTLRSPDISTWDPTNNPIVCQAEFPGVYPETTNHVSNGTVSTTELKTMLQSSSTYPGTNPAMTFASFFRRWVSVCNVANPVQGTYFLQVQTAKKIDGTVTPTGGGSNRFSLKVGIGGNFASDNNIHVYGNAKMGAYANATGANTQFYLTRVLPGEAGKTLVLNFFDTGDATQPGTLAVLPPSDSNVTGGVFAGCTYTQPPGNSVGPPWGTFSATATGCKITNVGNSTTPSYDGQWVTWKIPIPGNYTCDDTSASGLGCWTKLQFVYPAGTNVTDTTTWSAYMLGEPVRIIQ
jgi:Flp pilus assembly protein TadG